MQMLAKIVNWIVRLTGYAVGVTLILAVAALAIFGFTSFGARIVTEKIASTLSNRDMTIQVREPQGLLTGGLRAAEISISDTRGVFAEIHGIAIDWNPLALLTGTFHAKRFEIEAINVLRKPVRTLPSRPGAENSGGFALPIKVDIDRVALPDIKLAAPVAGRAFALAAEGSLSANGDGGEAVVNVSRHAVPDARLAADIAYAPAENRLRLKAQLSEPKGGLLAGFLGLPDSPAVNIDLDGQGPISDWKGKVQAALDGQQRAAIEARHQITADGLHHLDLKGGGDLSSLLPSAFRPLFAGQTNIDLATTFDDRGKIDIQTGNIATGSVVIAASGTLDPAGNNSLNANLLGTSGPVDFRWPLAEGEARFLISGLNLALTGDAQAARLNVSGSLDTATLPQANIGNIKLTAKSDAFNLAARSGSVQLRLVAGDTTFTDPNLNRAVQGPVTIASPLQISPSGIGFNGTTVESANINGGLNGSYRLADKALTGNLKLTINPAALPAAMTSRFDGPISLESQVVGTIPSKFALSNLVLKSGTLEAAGNVALDGGTLNADLSGRLPDIGKLIPGASGGAGYALRVGGELPAISVTANLKAASLEMADRVLGNLNIDLSGLADPKAPQGRIAATGTIDGRQPIGINGDITSQDGKISIPALTADIGGNRLTGNAEFSPTLEPTAALTFDFPNVGLLAALGGQKAEGDLKGSLGVSSDSGKIALKLLATGGSIHRDTLAIVKPDIDVTISDLNALAANGTIKAEGVSAGTNKLAGLSLGFTKQQNHTDFDLDAAYDGNPVLAAGNIEAQDGTIHLNLDRFSASPRNIPIELAAPTQVAIGGGAANLNGLMLKTGTGSVTVSGSAGETLKLDADIRELPAALANGFVPNLSAGGTISGTIAVTGTPAAPVADFKLGWKDATTGQTKGAGLAPLDITAGGKFADNKLDFDTTVGSNDGLSLKAAGNVALADPKAPVLDVNADILNLPARIANGFVPDLAAAGTITGKVTASGSLAAPTANFDLNWKDAATSQTKRAGLADLGVKATGKFADNKLDFDTAIGGGNSLSVKATGNVAITGTTIGNVKVDAALANVPANIANSFAADLAAEGAISGKISASGSLSAPSADFDLTWKDAATSHTKRAGLAALGVTASGKFADNKLDFNAVVGGANSLSLKANGNLAIKGTTIDNLTVDATLANVPANIANSFVADLAAEGAISGRISATGSLPVPNADFDLTWKDAATSHTKRAGLAALGVTASGKFAENKLDFNAAVSGDKDLSLKAMGNVALAGTAIDSIKVDAEIAKLPASLANAFVPNLAAGGTISGTTSASGTLAAPKADFKLDWTDAATSQTRSAHLSGLALTTSGRFADDRLDFNATLAGKDGLSLKAAGNVAILGTSVKTLDVKADLANLPAGLANGFVPGLAAEGTVSGTASASGALPKPAVDFKLDWKNAATAQPKSSGLSGLSAAASGKFVNDRVDFDANLAGKDGVLAKATGGVTIAGTAIRDLSINADIPALPANIANAFVPGLGAEGTLSANAITSGTPANPIVDFKLNWKDAATSHTKAAGLSRLALAATGKYAGDRLDFDAALNGSGGIALKAAGNLAIAGTSIKSLDVTANTTNLPAGIANGFVPGLAAEGAVSATAKATGALSAPSVDFKVDWKNAATSQTKGAGLSPFNIGASGKLAGNRLTVDTSLAGDAGMSLKGGGSVVITGNRALDMRFNGNLPFAVLGAPLAQQGLVADGVATVNLQIGGTAAAPVINGTVSTSGAKLVDVRRNLAVNNLAATVTFNGSQAVISRLSGNLGGGGTISASGTIGIQPAGGFPADISIKLDKAVYVDGTLVVSTVNGTVGLRGPIMNATLSGKLRLDKTSITVPEKLPTSLREVDIRHKNAPRAVLAQLRDDGERKPGEKSSVITLDLEIDAPSHIFVRGRGIDAELGGRVTIRGTAAAPIVTGGFIMRRGRMTILNRRLDFSDKSRITFAGDLTPALDMEATSASGSTTLTVDVAGLATDPAITFSSSPQLPQDEVLAQLIFGQSMSKLSPVQIAQLADAVSQLAGNRSTSLFEGLRNQLGVDDFDVSTDSKGQTSVSVGRYLNDRTYFELQQGGSAGAKAVINLDVGRGVKLRGAAGGNGAGEAGIVYEREY
ncbi:filamentous hemagglutinin adherence factor [Rhizobium leguminosarum]|uniref:translocation/assembly module TamB domain-containing protein n=1 Tax=Rhizobium leguminosarum TaxID=384 RepID=UPI001030F58E|nr:translocation/assembly module TamB domain-containing protein [Rhizobium leguminosarum]QIO74989.1 filamentous hemagglutinin adherence factor [Rhizobium leguminosarum bv. trifolii]QIO82006.1 filamentous hemagglutinin adherence factor [Rhizobium leguminosarum bv. trifolii]TAU23510.1 filamentous hemagglutinin adherence factor [Rhizobium leguminosarum]TAU43529.1 filamentous hemagglutinin adherence factor [Rhizobium leguminosarum]TAZ64697.1 filamentous hemagglutinin adherence factor [Rhizobium le